MHKRTLLTALALSPLAALTACGFRLRGAPQFAFRSLYVQAQPGSPLAKQLHAALRTVLQMSADGARWQAAQAGVLEQAAQEAQRLAINHAHLAERLVPDADWIASRIRAGTATIADVAGAEVYRTEAAHG